MRINNPERDYWIPRSSPRIHSLGIITERLVSITNQQQRSGNSKKGLGCDGHSGQRLHKKIDPVLLVITAPAAFFSPFLHYLNWAKVTTLNEFHQSEKITNSTD